MKGGEKMNMIIKALAAAVGAVISFFTGVFKVG